MNFVKIRINNGIKVRTVLPKFQNESIKAP